MQKFDEHFEVVVVGAGHAGCEAAMAAARMGLKTALFTLNVDLIAQMSCNPAIGGIAKGHLVREVDALGGIMGEITDAVGIQFRLLNTSRGPAVWSPRAQCDKQAYRLKMREVLESQPNLSIKQAEVSDVILEKFPIPNSQLSDLRDLTENRELTSENCIRGILLRDGRRVSADAVIITTGTFLNGLIHCGEQQYPAGRSGEPAAVLLGEALKETGPAGMPSQDGYSAASRWTHHRLVAFRAPARRCRPHAFQFSNSPRGTSRFASPLLHRLHQRRDASNHPRKCPSFAHV